MLIDDLIVLGRACPEVIKSGRITVCTAGYSHKLGFVRVYPTHPMTPWKVWDIVQVPVEAPPQDSRLESWKIEGSKKEWEALHEKVKVVGRYPESERLSLLSNLVDPCVNLVNDSKRSLGLVQPVILNFGWETAVAHKPTQLGLWKKSFHTKDDYPLEPRIRYRCSTCTSKKPHEQQVLEWGFYEWLRKHPEAKDQVWENAKITSNEYAKFFLVGNQSNRRTSFLIVSVMRAKKGAVSLPLQPLVKVTDNKNNSLRDTYTDSSAQLLLVDPNGS